MKYKYETDPYLVKKLSNYIKKIYKDPVYSCQYDRYSNKVKVEIDLKDFI